MTVEQWTPEDVQRTYAFLRDVQLGGVQDSHLDDHIRGKLMLHDKDTDIEGQDIVSFVHKYTLPHREWRKLYQQHMSAQTSTSSTPQPPFPSSPEEWNDTIKTQSQEDDLDPVTPQRASTTVVMLGDVPIPPPQRSRTGAAMHTARRRLDRISAASSSSSSKPASGSIVNRRRTILAGAMFRQLPLDVDDSTGEIRTNKDRDLVAVRLVVEPRTEMYSGYQSELRPPSPLVLPRTVFTQLQKATQLKFPSQSENPWGPVNLAMPANARVELVEHKDEDQRAQHIRDVLQQLSESTRSPGVVQDVLSLPGWVQATLGQQQQQSVQAPVKTATGARSGSLLSRHTHQRRSTSVLDVVRSRATTRETVRA